MKYTMKAGVLYQDEKILVRLKSSFNGPEKNVILADGTLILRTDIRDLDVPAEKSGDVRFRRYIIFDENGKECAVAKPDYAEGDDPEIVGWPICRMPKIDHAQFLYHNDEYMLTMQNSQNYSLTDRSGKTDVQIFHRGLIGGWNIIADNKFTPEMICGIFAFCRYMERENEFLTV